MTGDDVLVVLRPRVTGDMSGPLRRVRDRLQRLYGPLFPDAQVDARWDASGTHVLAVVSSRGHQPTAGRVMVWGLPVGTDGEATDDELRKVAADPTAARALLGTWALVSEDVDGLRLVSSADLVHTLVRAEGPEGTAYSTRGLAALAAAGAPARVAEERIPELVLFDFVFGDDELIEGTRVLEEATVVETGRRGERITSYWPVEERFAPGPPTDARRLREVLGADLERLAAVPGVHLALTAGRDSTLVASCLQERGLALPTFTMGPSTFPDAVGAAAVAREWGTSHRLMTAPPEPGPVELQRAVRKSAWSEGLDIAWNLVGSGMVWDGPSPMVWLAGSGGEIGRAFYWQGAVSSTDALVDQLCARGERLGPQARDHLRQRVVQAVEDAEASGRVGWGALDVLYARGRMRKWLMRTMPRPEARGLLAAFTSPAVVQALLDIPESSRRSGSVFDEALALGRPNLHHVARAALSVPAPAAPSLARRVAARLPARPRRIEVAGDLGRVLSQLPEDLVCPGVLGRRWYDDTRRGAKAQPWLAHHLWNVVSVEALSLYLASA